MSVYTPRGLRIQLSREYCFALIGRLGRDASADEVFRTAEAIHSFPWALAFVAGVAALAARGPAWAPGLAVALAAPAGFLLLSAGAAHVPGVLAAGGAYRTAAWFGVPLALVLVGGPLIGGWRATAGYVSGWVVARLVVAALDRLECRRRAARDGLPLRGADRSLALAYRVHARRLGRHEGLWPDREDYDTERWAGIYERFAQRHPEAVRKFT
ncbi:MAG: hypothetical protein EHM24_20160 [Acidobacteria bacterium]|nr:MAG: hypothetical protein EHM24_20160 [Acidobacteriota bacterium]